MPDQIAAQQFQLLRARVEAEMPAPACITVTSACERDGKSVTASGLAEHLAGAGYRVLIVDASGKRSGRSKAAASGGAASVDTAFSQICKTTTPKLEALRLADEFAIAASAEKVRALLQTFRDAYDYTIVDASRLLDGNLGLLFAAASDGTLISLRRGRAAVAADPEMIRVLESSRVKVLGIVTASPAAIREYSRRGTRIATLLGRHEEGLAPAGMSAVRSG